ncbi:hypothetical protein ISREJYDI_CDS0187 [Pseudomonas phage UNO-G1W1]|uniref:Uncharacterized protein n=1 Tax=Pseudomonas phage UNO-G1W1 TaxID=3136609 RepID=A0AAX4QM46_9CAUD
MRANTNAKHSHLVNVFRLPLECANPLVVRSLLVYI